MLEYPESHYLAEQINENLKGKQIEKIETLHSPHGFAFFWGEREGYPLLLTGRTITGAVAHGGILQINAEDSIIVFTDGISPKYYDSPDKYPKKHQFFLGFTDGSALAGSIQMYGVIGVYGMDLCREPYYLTACNSPDMLSEEFTYEYFLSVLKQCEGKKLSVKAFLATEQRFPGLGNGVLQDILWNAEIHPKTNVWTLSDKELHRLYISLRETIGAMTSQGGRDVDRMLYGEPGGYRTKLSKLTLGHSCEHCGHELVKCAYMGGVVYYCEGCQKTK